LLTEFRFMAIADALGGDLAAESPLR
jgi:hypothetical protein